ncbi:DUF2849 domain-containing protein [Sulfitobacter sp. HNIBRBA2951]|uniref:DUF2849 domain-containing protein n=1 Tax=Sulfitobacter aquimarinus TaxID=3158557 RepID=UPI0032DF91AC
MPKAFKPSVITANALLLGDVVYLRGTTWVRDLAEAEVLHDEAQANARLEGAATLAGEQVVGVYLMPVSEDSGTPTPAHFREAFRARGPSNYAHGKQETQ